MHLIWAIRAFWRALLEGEKALTPTGAQAPPPPETAFRPSAEPAIQLLALLQKEGRLVDFLAEEIKSYSDAEIGAAVREIHAGCRRVLDGRFRLERVLDAAEGASAQIPAGYDASAIALAGNASGAGPHTGIVRHRGWRVAETRLPTVAPGADASIVQPAEVEVAR